VDGPDLVLDPMSSSRSSFWKVGLGQEILYLSGLHYSLRVGGHLSTNLQHLQRKELYH